MQGRVSGGAYMAGLRLPFRIDLAFEFCRLRRHTCFVVSFVVTYVVSEACIRC